MLDTPGCRRVTEVGCARPVTIVALSRESATIASPQTAAWMWRPWPRAKGSVHTTVKGAPCRTRGALPWPRWRVARCSSESSRFRAKARQSHPGRQPPGCGDPGCEPKAQFTQRPNVGNVGHAWLSHGHGGGLRAACQNRRAFARKRDNASLHERSQRRLPQVLDHSVRCVVLMDAPLEAGAVGRAGFAEHDGGQGGTPMRRNRVAWQRKALISCLLARQRCFRASADLMFCYEKTYSAYV